MRTPTAPRSQVAISPSRFSGRNFAPWTSRMLTTCLRFFTLPLLRGCGQLSPVSGSQSAWYSNPAVDSSAYSFAVSLSLVRLVPDNATSFMNPYSSCHRAGYRSRSHHQSWCRKCWRRRGWRPRGIPVAGSCSPGPLSAQSRSRPPPHPDNTSPRKLVIRPTPGTSQVRWN